MGNGKKVGSTIWRYKNFLIITLTALLLLPLPLLVSGQEALCGYLMLVMAVYWCSEALPLAVTGCIPIFIMPLLGLLTSEEVCYLYMKESTMMFFGGMMVALAFEKCNLHTRIALTVLRIMGTKPIWLMLGFMFPTWFLSMWISNTATTSMMLPILEAVLVKLGESLKGRKPEHSMVVDGHNNHAMTDMLTEGNLDNDAVRLEHKVISDEAIEMKQEIIEKKSIRIIDDQYELPRERNSKHFDIIEEIVDGESDVKSDGIPETADHKFFLNLCKGMTLSVCYSANIGGTATLTGTTPNIIMKNFADDLWQENLCIESPINFASWMVYGAPAAFILLLIMWMWLAIFFLGLRGFKDCCSKSAENENSINADILRQQKSLGPMSYAEWWTLFIFMSMVLLWFFRSPGFMKGWGDLMPAGYVGDSVPSMLCTVALFILPLKSPRCGSEKEHGKAESLLDWQIIHERFPWGILFLVGGGFALAEACEKSGLSDVIGDALTVFDVLPPWFMVTVLTFITAMLTEFTSNTATCTLIMPIVASMAETLGLNPLYLMLPCAVSTSLAFMLPVATPPNAIAFSYGHLTVFDMVKAGALLNIIGIFVLTLATETWGMVYFKFDQLPWDANTTSCAVTAAAVI